MHRHDIDTRDVGRSTLTAALAVRVVGTRTAVPTTAGRAATKGWDLYCNNACTDAEGKGKSNNKTWAGKDQSAAAVPVLCAVCCCGSERKRSDEESWS